MGSEAWQQLWRKIEKGQNQGQGSPKDVSVRGGKGAVRKPGERGARGI